MASGTKNPFLLSDIYKIYVDIWRIKICIRVQYKTNDDNNKN